MEVYTSPNIRQTKMSKSDFNTLVSFMQTDTATKDAVEKVRAAEDKHEARFIKERKLSYFTFNTYKDNLRNSKSFRSTRVLTFDIDNVPKKKLETLFKKVSKSPGVILAFRSPSYGIKFSVIFDNDIKKQDYVKVYTSVMHSFSHQLDIELDPSCSDLQRGCYVSYDEDLYHNLNVEPKSLDFVLKHLEHQKSTIGHKNLAIVQYNMSERGFTDMYEYMTQQKGYTELTDQKEQGMVALSRPGVDHRSATLFDGSAPDREGLIGLYLFTDNDDTLNSSPEKLSGEGRAVYKPFDLLVSDKYKGNFKEAEKYVKEVCGFEDIIIEESSDLSMIWHALISCYQFRLDIRKQRLSVNRANEGWKHIDDRLVSQMYVFLNAKFKRKVVRNDIIYVIEANAERVDPLQDWMNSLKSIKIEDDFDYVKDYWINCWGEALGNEFDIVLLKKWLVGALASVEIGPVSNDICITLKGAQGIGKSKWIRHMCPDSLLQFFYEGQISDSKDSTLRVATNFIISLDELEGTMGKKEIASLKSIMSIPTITSRINYDRYDKDYVRFCSFMGSVNQSRFLNDPTGARRFPVFDLGNARLNFDYMFDYDISNLWAYALKLLRSGFQYWLSEDEIAIVNERAKEFSYKGAFQEEITDRFDIVTKEFRDKYVFTKSKRRFVCVYLKGDMEYRYVKPELFPRIKNWGKFYVIDVSLKTTTELYTMFSRRENVDDRGLKAIGRTMNSLECLKQAVRIYDEEGLKFTSMSSKVYWLIDKKIMFQDHFSNMFDIGDGGALSVDEKGRLLKDGKWWD